jgi:hypothetical protein
VFRFPVKPLNTFAFDVVAFVVEAFDTAKLEVVPHRVVIIAFNVLKKFVNRFVAVAFVMVAFVPTRFVVFVVAKLEVEAFVVDEFTVEIFAVPVAVTFVALIV